MVTIYPAYIDTAGTNGTLPDVSDLSTVISGVTINRVRDAVIAIETQLGVKPAGLYATVRARLDAIENTLNIITGNFGNQNIVTTGGIIAGPAIFGSVSTSLFTLGGIQIFNGISTPGLSDTGQAILYYDSSLNELMLSEDGYAYFALGSSSGDFGSQNITTTGQIISGPLLATSVTSGFSVLNGMQIINGISAPAVSDTGQAIIYYDSSTNKLMASEDGYAYVDLIGGEGSSTLTLVVNGSSPTINKGYAIQEAAGNTITLGTNNPTTNRFLGIVLNNYTASQLANIQIAGMVDPAIVNLGDGYRCAIGINSSGALVRVTDSTCISGLNYIGWCDEIGIIVISPRIAENVNVKDFGAKGDGVTDDTVPIHTAVSSLTSIDTGLVGWVGGGIVYFPSGTYLCNSVINLPLDIPITIQGEGPYATQIQFITASNGIQQLYPLGTKAATNIIVRDLQIVNKITNSIEISAQGNYWRSGIATTTWGSAGTLIAFPGPSNRLLQLVTPGATGSFLPYNGAHLWCYEIGPTSATTVSAGSSGTTINATSTQNFLASGTIHVATSLGIQTITYTGITGTTGAGTFTGCSGLTGVPTVGGTITGPAPYPHITGNAITNYAQIVIEVGDPGRVNGSGMDYRFSTDGGGTFSGYQFSTLSGESLGATGLTITFPDANYGAPLLYTSPALSTGFSNIVGDIITESTGVQWEVIDGTNGLLFQNCGSVHIERVSCLGFTNAIVIDGCVVVDVKTVETGNVNGIWIVNGNERQNAQGATINIGDGTNAISFKDILIFNTGIGIANSGGISHLFEGITFESTTASVGGNTNQSSWYVWGTAMNCVRFSDMNGEGAYGGFWLGTKAPFTGGFNETNAQILVDSVFISAGQGGFGGPAVEFGTLGATGLGIGTGTQLATFERSFFHALVYAYGVEGVGSAQGLAFYDCFVGGQSSAFDTTITNGGLFIYESTSTNVTGTNQGQAINCLPLQTFDLAGSLGLNVHSISTTYIVDSGSTPDCILLCSGSAFSITLPAPTNRRILKIKNATNTATNYTILPHGSETIDGLTSYILTGAWQSIELVSDGTNWFSI